MTNGPQSQWDMTDTHFWSLWFFSAWWKLDCLYQFLLSLSWCWNITQNNYVIYHKQTEKTICRYGAPEKFVADNGWQFAHNETFDVIMKEFGVTPYHPETNGEIQKDAIKTLKNPSKQLLLLVNSR